MIKQEIIDLINEHNEQLLDKINNLIPDVIVSNAPKPKRNKYILNPITHKWEIKKQNDN